mmetsp:Transcript_62526/g.116970  ORF Transcript_62526/g.116970 Transcript_62526/m.116970 type:complete len:250 (+) Transcript_62526:40-789(+)
MPWRLLFLGPLVPRGAHAESLEPLGPCLRRALRTETAWNVTPCWPSPWGPYNAGEVGSTPAHPSWSDLVDVYDAAGTHAGVSSAWEAQTSCLWHRTVYVVPRLPDGRVLFQRRAEWKWRMGGFWDLGVSETLEVGEDLRMSAWRAVQEELGRHAAPRDLQECCRLKTGWSGALPNMQLCQFDQNVIYTALGDDHSDFGERDAEVAALEYWSLDEYALQAESDRFKFAPWVHAIVAGCPRCFRVPSWQEL